MLQEALACGLPVICGQETAAADPGASALIEGVAIEGADPDTAVAALGGAHRPRSGRQFGIARAAAAEARHAYVLSRYSWTEAARAYLSIMTGLVERPRPSPLGRFRGRHRTLMTTRPPTAEPIHMQQAYSSAARRVRARRFEQQRRLQPRLWDTDWLVLRGMRDGHR